MRLIIPSFLVIRAKEPVMSAAGNISIPLVIPVGHSAAVIAPKMIVRGIL